MKLAIIRLGRLTFSGVQNMKAVLSQECKRILNRNNWCSCIAQIVAHAVNIPPFSAKVNLKDHNFRQKQQQGNCIQLMMTLDIYTKLLFNINTNLHINDNLERRKVVRSDNIQRHDGSCIMSARTIQVFSVVKFPSNGHGYGSDST